MFGVVLVVLVVATHGQAWIVHHLLAKFIKIWELVFLPTLYLWNHMVQRLVGHKYKLVIWAFMVLMVVLITFVWL